MASLSTGILMILGIGVFGGIIGGGIFQRLHIPQVVGYIAMGLLSSEHPPNWYAPANFSAEVKGLPLLSGASLGDEIDLD